MVALRAWRFFAIPFQRTFVRSVGNVASEQNVKPQEVYKTSYTEEELIQYFIDNVVHSTTDCVVTSVPQGVNFIGENKWSDYEGYSVCRKSLQDLIPNLRETFQTEYIFVTKYPRRNASGLLLLSKNFKTFQQFRTDFVNLTRDLKRIYSYLAVVIGQPSNEMIQTFNIATAYDGGEVYTAILDKNTESGGKVVETKYRHKVVDATKEFSLLEISVSYDLRDSVRHILAQKCFTPAFGDTWNIRRAVNFLFGSPVPSQPWNMMPEPYSLSEENLKKLHLTPNEQNSIPIHVHLYSLNMPFKRSTFFVSVPPPKSFVWTCQQLGLHKIQQYMKSS